MQQASLFPDRPPPISGPAFTAQPRSSPPGPALMLSLDYAGQPVRMVGTADRPQWVAADVCRVLTIANPRAALADFDDDEKGVAIVDTPGGRQQIATVTEAGVFRLAFVSRKPDARAFRRWVCHDVLPSIHRHGTYPPPAPSPLAAITPPRGLCEALDPATDLIPLSTVPSLPWLPRRPVVDTVYQWHRHGLRGVYLETVRVAGRLYTTESAVLIFMARTASPNPRPDAPLSLTLNVGGERGEQILQTITLEK